MLGLVLPWWWRWAAFAGLAVACMGFVAFKMHEHDQKAYDELAREFGEFKGRVAALGEKAKADALAQQAADKKRKGDADAENKRNSDTLRADVERLRNERDRASGRELRAAATDPANPDRTCFERPAAERAYGELVTKLRGIIDACENQRIGLDTAKKWAQSIK